MKIYREGANKIITEIEESDCGGNLETLEMATDAIFSGMKAAQKAVSRGVRLINEDVPELVEGLADFKERWEIIDKPADPPAGGEDAR